MRIACLHTVESNVAVFEAALADLGRSDVSLVHEVRADLLADAERAGRLTPEITERTAAALAKLADQADAVLLTCSTVGPAVAEVALPVPALRVDGALAEAAVAKGGTVVALCAVETTVGPTGRLFEDAARPTGATVETRLVPGAWAAFKGGDRAGYHRLVAEAADRALAEGAACVALAQASMAGAAKMTRLAPPLTSPAVGLAAAVAAAEARQPAMAK